MLLPQTCSRPNGRPTITAAMLMSSDSLQGWLERNSVRCERLGALIEPGFCRRYRTDNPACTGCEQAEEMDREALRLADKWELQPDPVTMGAQKEEAVAKAEAGHKKICLECEDPKKKVVGRGLCGTCYARISNAGLLNEKYPLAGTRTETVKSSDVAEPDRTEDQKENAAMSAGLEKGDGVPDVLADRPVRKQRNHLIEVSVRFFERDAPLLEALRCAALKNRRSVSAEILFRLESDMGTPGDPEARTVSVPRAPGDAQSSGAAAG